MVELVHWKAACIPCPYFQMMQRFSFKLYSFNDISKTPDQFQGHLYFKTAFSTNRVTFQSRFHYGLYKIKFYFPYFTAALIWNFNQHYL